MNRVFADSFYFFALLNPRDEAHPQAKAFSDRFDGEMVTTAWVLTELADGLSAPPRRTAFTNILDSFQSDPSLLLIPPSVELFQAGADLFRSRADKMWSLTDCISFVVMQAHGLTDALTGDHHFVQAGFRALLVPPGR